MIGSALRQRLLDVTGVTDLVGIRIYPMKLPQEPTFPAIVYQRISGDHEHAHGTRASGLAMPRYQFDAYADTYTGADNLGEQIRLALQGFSGTISYDSPAQTMKVWAIFAESDHDIGFDDKTELYRRSFDFFIHHQETIPA